MDDKKTEYVKRTRTRGKKERGDGKKKVMKREKDWKNKIERRLKGMKWLNLVISKGEMDRNNRL